MQHYIFTTKDIRNTLIKSATDDTIKFTVSTTSVEENNFKPKTEIRRMSEKAPLAVVIHWDDRIFEIEGRKLSFTTTKVHPSVLFSPTTYVEMFGCSYFMVLILWYDSGRGSGDGMEKRI
ncbi:hypothetical protein PTI98_007065 [Pleurotus ostreatus]|nr:hypothetical protein PTI98_007065 [Pleurotus ostreatus]